MSIKKVIVELRAPTIERAMTLAVEPGLERYGFKIDKDWKAISLISEESSRLALALEPEEQTVCIRGEVFEERLEELKAAPNVVKVWTDSKIMAFHSIEEELETFTWESFTLDLQSPCSPFDCDPITPRGDINDVVKYLGADYIWREGYRGEGIVIGICDTGVLKTRFPVIDGWSPNPIYPWGVDLGGHGSMCAFDALGICPEAKIYDIGVLKSGAENYEGFLSDALAGFQWALNRYKEDGTPQILSNSWGVYQESWAPDYAKDPNHPFTRKVKEAINLGIIVTFAAGNCGAVCPDRRCGTDTGSGRSIWGANSLAEVITFGAANLKEEWIGYSSQGPGALSEKKTRCMQY